MRIDGEVSGSKVYRGENAVGTFLSNILQEEVKIRESLAEKKPIVKSLIKDEFLDSLPVWRIEDGEGGEKCSYKGQGHKKCFYREQKEQQWGILNSYRQRFSLRKTHFLPLKRFLKCYGAKCH